MRGNLRLAHDDDAVPALAFGPVCRGVGGGVQRGGSGSGHRGEPDAHRRAVGRGGGTDLLLQSLGDSGRLLCSGSGQQQRELVAAQPAGRVARPRQAGQDAADQGEDAVPGGMAMGVVDVLEPVDVDDEQADRMVGVRPPRLPLQSLVARAVVQSAGETSRSARAAISRA